MFDGIYGDLARVGLPIPLVASLHSKNLTLEGAMWNVRCSATGFSVSLFWPSGSAVKKQKKRRLRRRWTRKKAKSTEDNPSEATECCLQQEKATGKGGLACEVTIPNNAPTEPPTCPSLPPDTPSISKVGNNSDTDAQSESEELAVLDKVVHIGQNVFDSAEFVLQESGPVLKYRTKTGLAITPIKMPNLDEDDDVNSSAMEYLKSCKAIEYVRVDGKPGLTLQRGRCRFWTSVVVTPEVVRLEPD